MSEAALPPSGVRTLPLCEATDRELLTLSEKGLLSLSLEEMKAIQKHFQSLRRDPTDAELETLAQTWSEHCKHKTFRGRIEYLEAGHAPRIYDNLLKSTVMRAMLGAA